MGPGNIANPSLSHGMTRKSEIVRNASSGSSLGIFRSQSTSKKGITRESFQAHLLSRTRQQKCSQTILSFPVRLENTIVKRTISQAGVRINIHYELLIKTNKSLDETSASFTVD